jgi:hypothetical protein
LGENPAISELSPKPPASRRVFEKAADDGTERAFAKGRKAGRHMANTNTNDLVLGDLVAAAFDRARTVTADPELAAVLATRTLGRWLAGAEMPDRITKWEPMLPGPKRPARGAARPSARTGRHKRAA